MATPLLQQVERGLRIASPYVAVVLLIILVRLPLRTDGLGLFMPFIGLAFVFYWSVHSREGVPAIALLVLGLLEDAVSGAPLGLSSIVLITVYAVLGNQQRFFVNKGFAAGWIGFAAIVLAVLAMVWLLWSFYEGRAMALLPLALSMLATIAVYPLLGLLFGRIHKLVLRVR